MLKRDYQQKARKDFAAAAFGRLCVETVFIEDAECEEITQPPSGGCVLKRKLNKTKQEQQQAAAFGRLCVETG